MSVWSQEVPTEGAVELPPDPRAMNALGRNHSLETALADLVDNSIDAGATDILVRFVQRGTRLVGLYVVDNGRGIEPERIDAAMTVGGQRRYTSEDLGHFGLGLKAASFSQAASLTVLSRAAGHKAVGRRWQLNASRHGFACDIVPGTFAAAELDRNWQLPASASGTVVRWDQVNGLPSSDDPDQVDEFLSRTISHLQGHLGLTFHRIIAGRGVRIVIDVEDIHLGAGVRHRVAPIDPFAYPDTLPGWPKDLKVRVNDNDLVLRCHIWPRRSNTPEYRLPGGAEARQGLYFYRRSRLLHAGGWEGIHAADTRLQLARVSIDIDGDTAGMFAMNPEKSRVSAGPRFASAVAAARADDGTTITDYLQAAEAAWINANRRTTARRKAVLPPGKGFHPKVSREIRNELPLLHEEPLNIQWKRFTTDAFLEFDRNARTLWLNRAYRQALLGGRRGGGNDLPVLKALLFLLVGNVFEGAHFGARDKDNMDIWQEILTAAAKAEKSTFEARS
ncbi:ATP-binding protein [Micromonospora sp. C28SCA-DRY-2]|uniref:ATP-binding protein n=1 Tax=Micromonospora sp. C28SCA-DRY-2 TaxID=3059522 RepID=UPI0026753780|nr:ATP-binding protein [Micromonospora sp. C28SCA-DRY-2]MDO3704073.1 ATP-binding protein [Micromonospora sp. C28SCA-DRY-2]